MDTQFLARLKHGRFDTGRPPSNQHRRNWRALLSSSSGNSNMAKNNACYKIQFLSLFFCFLTLLLCLPSHYGFVPTANVVNSRRSRIIHNRFDKDKSNTCLSALLNATILSSSPPSLSSIFSSTSSSAFSSSSSSYIEFIDPKTQCHVTLLGCFHGTYSSAQDVRSVISKKNPNIIVLELCHSRFLDLQKEFYNNNNDDDKQKQTQINQQVKLDRSLSFWPVRYLDMVIKTIEKSGISTGIAAAVLGGFSGLQSAMSGFIPGLEFTTVLELLARDNTDGDENDPMTGHLNASVVNCEIILGDQTVDETLRKLGNLPAAINDIFIWEQQPDDGQRQRRTIHSIIKECIYHLQTLQYAIFGRRNSQPQKEKEVFSSSTEIPQVQLASVLLRNQAAIQDLMRLALPSVLLIILFSRILAATLHGNGGIMDDLTTTTTTLTSLDTTITLLLDPTFNVEIIKEWMIHLMASGFILTSTGMFAMLPIVKIILTERDEILSKNIQIACQRAGKDGQVVAILGLLHVNGVAQRMILASDSTTSIISSGAKEERNEKVIQ